MFRISLRQLLLLTAVVALALVTLRHPSDFWQGFMGLILMFAVSTAVVVGIFDRGPRQAFAIAFALVALAYLVLVITGHKLPGGFNSELDPQSGSLPSTILLRYLNWWIVGSDQLTSMSFMPIGHTWWALVFGYVCGMVARYVYVGRLPEKSSAAETRS